MKRHVKASHASATPATDGRIIVALLGSEGLFCFDMTGTLKWRQDLGVMDVGLVDDPTYQWGPASSPVIAGNLVIVQNDRHKESFVAALRHRPRASRCGAPRTTSCRRGRRLSSSLIAKGAVVVTNAGKYIRGLDARTGREMWRLADSQTQVKVPTPVVANDLIVVTGGYPPGGRPIYAIKRDGAGDLGAGRDCMAHGTRDRRIPERRCSTTASSTSAPTMAS